MFLHVLQLPPQIFPRRIALAHSGQTSVTPDKSDMCHMLKGTCCEINIQSSNDEGGKSAADSEKMLYAGMIFLGLRLVRAAAAGLMQHTLKCHFLPH